MKLLRIGVIAYLIAGLAYWTTAQLYLRYIGKEIVFTPLLSILLTVPSWPMMVYADLKWIGLMPYDLAAICAVPVTIYLLRKQR